MSISLRIASVNEHQDWILPDTHVETMNALDSQECKRALVLLLGPDDLAFGGSWQVKREELIAGIQCLSAGRARGGGGFQVRAATGPDQTDMVGRSLSGLEIGGAYYIATCRDDYWLLWQSEQKLPSGIIDSPKRYDTVELVTENIGVVRIERRKTGKRDVIRLLDDILAFVRRQQTESLTRTLG